jgi:hypothetical protein
MGYRFYVRLLITETRAVFDLSECYTPSVEYMETPGKTLSTLIEGSECSTYGDTINTVKNH